MTRHLGQASMPSAAAAARAAGWLDHTWANRAGDEPGLAVDALALACLCGLIGGGGERIVATADAIAGTIPPTGWTETTLLAGLIAATGAASGSGPAAAGARAYLDLIADVEPHSLSGANGALVAVAMHGVDAVPPTTLPDAALLYDDEASLRKLLAEVEAASAFGARPLEAPPPLPELVDGAAIAALRRYDLPLAMRLLRARRYLSSRPSAGTRAGLDFLRLLQCPDGSFGDFDAALARMTAGGDRDAALRLKLPVAFQTLWTMAELETPDFSLVPHLFAGMSRAGARRAVLFPADVTC